MKSIKTQMVLTLILVTGLVFGFLNQFVERKIQEFPEYFLANYQEIAHARADELSKELYGMIEQVGMVARTDALLSMDLETIQAYLKTQVIVGKFRNMTFSDIEGNAWATYDQMIDISDQAQFQAIIIQKKDWYISDPFYSPYIAENVPIITISHAIKIDNEIVGLVNAVVSTSFVDQVVRGIKFKNEGFGWITSSTGKIVSHPSEDVTIDDDLGCLIDDLSAQNDLLQNDHGYFDYINCENIESIGVFAHITHTKNWKLVLSLDRQSAYGDAYRILDQIQVAFLVMIALLIIFAFMYSDRVTRPILKLKEVFDEAALGNFNVSAEESTKNEIGMAGKSFNAMLAQLKSLTYQDPIIDLYNYQSYLLELNYYLTQNLDQELMNYIVIVSIDDFKKINSMGGYEFGNMVLHDFAQKINREVKSNELIARYFGDEIILLLADKSERRIRHRIETMLSVVSNPLTVEYQSIRLDVSMGIAFLPKYEGYQQVIHKATLAKLQAKKSGGHMYVMYDESIHQGLMYDQAMEDAMYEGFDNQEFYLVYQPIVDMMTQKTLGVEALLRWDHPLFKEIPIYRVIELAEQKGFIFEIGKYVLEESIKQCLLWQKIDPNFSVSVNVSALQLSDERFMPHLQGLMDSSQILPKTLTLEITETAAMSDVEFSMQCMSKIKDMGIQIAIDDFGTGYSSLAYLTKYPLHHIKIDRSFILAMDQDRNSKMLVLSLIHLAKSLDYIAIAEGVETQNHFSILRALGCQRAQGYFMSRPVRHELISERLSQEVAKHGDFFTK